MGIGKGGKRLNTHCGHLQELLETYRDQFLEVRSSYVANNKRHDYMREGLLGEIVSRTPIFIFDLPELVAKVSTAFVDRSGKMYIAAGFFERLVKEQDAGFDSLNFIFRHEADHLRRLHLSRMEDFPWDVANHAQDIRINSDIVKSACSLAFSDSNGNREPTPTELAREISDFFNRHTIGLTTISVGCGMNIEEYEKYDGMSEESIGAILLKDWKEPPKLPNKEVSFKDILEGAAQEADAIKVIVTAASTLAAHDKSMTPAELSHLANELRRIGKAKANPAKVTDADMTFVKDTLTKLRSHLGLLESEARHEQGSMACAGKGTVHTSSRTGDAYLDALRPTERVDLAIQILDQLLQPAAGDIPGNPTDGFKVKDIERSMGRGQGDGKPEKPDSSADSNGDGTGTEDMIPSPNVHGSQDHVMDTEELIDLLTTAGVSTESLKKLGYDDLKKVEEETKATKDNMISAINKATEDMMTVGARYPGGHLLNYAKAQLKDYFKPVLTWQMAYKKIIEGCGKGSRYDYTEPWTIYHVDAADMGYADQKDVPYMGSHVPGKETKPLVFVLVDTSGSVDDAMLKRFISEAVNMPRRMSRSTAPEVVVSFADTIARGEPVYITEKNYKSFLENGINYGGRGGTNLGAGIESVFEMVKPGSKSGFAKRNIDAIVYFTDTWDTAPNGSKLLKKAQECGLKKLPTTLFLAPTTCHNQAFKSEVAHFAETIFFDTKALMKIDLSKQDEIQARKNRSIQSD